ncbi:hypothetical protein P4506_02010, partial [Geobacillus stearothermophilus]|uniref:hypothetical protein n=1 Tax=Geobacillus stearothermophilus TaxID=1422 RepID=UPI0030C9B029
VYLAPRVVFMFLYEFFPHSGNFFKKPEVLFLQPLCFLWGPRAPLAEFLKDENLKIVPLIASSFHHRHHLYFLSDTICVYYSSRLSLIQHFSSDIKLRYQCQFCLSKHKLIESAFFRTKIAVFELKDNVLSF